MGCPCTTSLRSKCKIPSRNIFLNEHQFLMDLPGAKTTSSPNHPLFQLFKRNLGMNQCFVLSEAKDTTLILLNPKGKLKLFVLRLCGCEVGT